MAGAQVSPGPVPVSTSILARGSSRYADDEGARYASTYNAGMMLDEQLDQEMHNALRNLPTSDDGKYNSFAGNKISTSAALDLAHISQISPCASFATRTLETCDKSSEWPYIPNLAGTVNCLTLVAVPLLASWKALMLRFGTPHTPETQALNRRLASVGENALNAGDLQASLSRFPSGEYDGGLLTFNPIQPGGLDDTLQQQYSGGMDSVYGLNGLNGNGYNSYGFESGGRAGTNLTGTSISTALYHHNGSRYGLGIPARTNSGAGDGKMNGLHGPKQKCGDMDREFDRFAGTCLEDLQGEIPALCKG
ncbi:RNA-binding protein [Mycena sanguinolenta]|uniref:RNA-binding protein n=1 Tax=Mycena sanguinolenta TaxID=230812 RepID=A0A8H6U2L4_9AGAR|nr:RNA-binding protein [Mycena sanguinolenta]